MPTQQRVQFFVEGVGSWFAGAGFVLVRWEG